jgi:hypothetical protein
VSPVHWLAFGDLDAGYWGLAWLPDGDGAGSVALGDGDGARVAAARLASTGPGEEWRLQADGVDLTLEPVGGAVQLDGSTAGLTGFDQLARASGSVAIDGAERAVDSGAWRGVREGLPGPGKLESLRLVSAWFASDEGLALLALRPQQAPGQEADLVTATLFEPERGLAAADPRLSTTYGADGTPARAGVELWIADPRGPDADAEPHEHPYRAAGEASGPGTSWTADGIGFGVQPFRWHSHGHDGPGIYLLGRLQ